jgi:uncharacterized C2H2 Zn-finger protein
MVLYTCPKCNKEYTNKAHYDIHINRKTSCNEEERKIEKNLFCPICNKLYSSKRSLNKHFETVCMIKKISEEQKKKEEDEKNFLKNQIALLQEFIQKNNNKTIEDIISYSTQHALNGNISYNNELNTFNNSLDLISDSNTNNEQLNNEYNNQIKEPLIKKITLKNDSEKVNGFFYILKEREFIKTNENIYKIGKTGKECVIERFKQYPNESILYGSWEVKDCHLFENIMKNIFKLKFKLRNDIGIEYFEGNLKDMILTIENNFKNCY